jgi:hypothetical protein
MKGKVKTVTGTVCSMLNIKLGAEADYRCGWS